MRQLTTFALTAAIALGAVATFATHAALQRDATARAQTSQARFVLFEKFSRKS
jgi:hypothetical protein